MPTPTLSVRPIQYEDIRLIVQYWLEADTDHLLKMGADLERMPSKRQLTHMLIGQINSPMEQKATYALIWLRHDLPIGHCNVNKIVFGKEAYMHLHMWDSNYRQRGMGTELVKLSLPYFFENLQLETLYCEPYALNPAPNKTLEKVGFEFVKEYVTIPGSMNFEQPVKRWRLSREAFNTLEYV